MYFGICRGRQNRVKLTAKQTTTDLRRKKDLILGNLQASVPESCRNISRMVIFWVFSLHAILSNSDTFSSDPIQQILSAFERSQFGKQVYPYCELLGLGNHVSNRRESRRLTELRSVSYIGHQKSVLRVKVPKPWPLTAFNSNLGGRGASTFWACCQGCISR